MEDDPMAEKKNPSLWVALAALAFSAVVAGGLYWILPALPWWAYVIVALPFAGVAYKEWRGMIADKKIIDRESRLEKE
jgi:membrane protein implicated in regulation of membrane protease activity